MTLRSACCTLTAMCRLTVLLLLCLVGQASGPEPGRFGALGETLTAAEIAEVEDIASTARGRPWLVLGHRSTMSGIASIDVYLQPDVQNTQVRRGRLLRLIADDPPAVPQRSAWRVEKTMPFAYIGSPGRPPFTITAEQDVDWPFTIEGDIDDPTMVSLVAFIRSSPPLPDVPEGRFPRQVAAAPIAVIARRANTIIVALRTSAYTGQRVTVVRENGEWRITHFESWIV